MNVHVVSALLKDALYQVLDNKVFRLLAILIVLMLVLPDLPHRSSLRIAGDPLRLARVLLRGHLSSPSGLRIPVRRTPTSALIQTVQSLLVDEGLAGTFGICFCDCGDGLLYAAHAREGSGGHRVLQADLGRLTPDAVTLFRRDVLFVSILAALLVGGMHIGFLLNSGYSGSRVLVGSILTLIYLFALLHGFLDSGRCVHAQYRRGDFAHVDVLRFQRDACTAGGRPDSSSSSRSNRTWTSEARLPTLPTKKARCGPSPVGLFLAAQRTALLAAEDRETPAS